MRRLLTLSSVVPGLALLVLASAAQAGPPPGWKILESRPEGLRLEVTVPEAEVTALELKDGSFLSLSLPGYFVGGEPGDPALPSLAQWVALPPRGEATVTARILERQSMTPARLTPVPTAVGVPDPAFGQPRLREEYRVGSNYFAFRRGEADVVQLQEPVWNRKLRMAPLSVSPVIYDAASGQIEIARRLEIRITFENGEGTDPSAAAPMDALAPSFVLNPDMAPNWSQLPPHLSAKRERWREGMPDIRGKSGAVDGVDVFDATALLGPEVRLGIRDTGLSRIQLRELLDETSFPAGTLRRNVRLYQKRANDADPARPLVVDVPFWFNGSPDENVAIDAVNDVLVFYALDVRSDMGERDVLGTTFPAAVRNDRADNFNSDNIYWIAAMDPGTGSWARMDTETLGAATGTPPATFRQELRQEVDAIFQQGVWSKRAPRYHWSDNEERELSRTLAINDPDVTAGKQITVAFEVTRHDTRTSSRTNPGNGEFWPVEASAVRGDVAAPEIEWPLATFNANSNQFQEGGTVSGTIPADELGTGTFSLVWKRPEGVFTNLNCYLGSITTSYDALFVARGDVLRFRSGQVGGDVSVVVNGFTRDDILLFDVTDPYAPKRIALTAANVIDLGGGQFQLTVQAPQAAGVERVFHALRLGRTEQVRQDRMVEAAAPTVLDRPAQMLVIGPAEFESTMAPWFQWRRDHDTRGWTYDYYDVQQMYDLFSGGLKSPAAVKNFTEYAYTQWNAGGLLIVGDLSEDSREINRGSGPDMVPSHYHTQKIGGENPELMAADKWYTTFDPADTTDAYPGTSRKGPDMILARMPIQSAAELTGMVNKVIAYEQPSRGQTWRARTLWAADDAFSTGFFGGIPTDYCQVGAELQFEVTQIRMAEWVRTALDSTMVGDTFLLDDFTEPIRAPEQVGNCLDSIFNVRNTVAANVRPVFLNELATGGLIVSYQGHANFNILAHENLFLSIEGSMDPFGFANGGKQFLFFGMGCHITEFKDWDEQNRGRAVGELLATRADGGAIATYGSSGFEFLQPNVQFMEIISSNFFREYRTPGGNNFQSDAQWIVGEVLAASEIETLPQNISLVQEMVSQYHLLGDPLLRMDAAPPRLYVQQDGQPFEDTVLQPALGETTVPLDLHAVDESGVQSLEIFDSEGRSYTGLLDTSASGADPREVRGSINLPVLPRGNGENPGSIEGYTVTIAVRDEAYPEVEDWTTTREFSVPFSATLFEGTMPIGSAGRPVGAGETVSFALEFESPVPLTQQQIAISGELVTVSAVDVTPVGGDGTEWRATFDATGTGDPGTQYVVLTLAGEETRIRLSEGVDPGPFKIEVVEHYAFPNPATTGDVRFVVEATNDADWAQVSVYDLTGRQVHRIEQSFAGATQLALEWDGLDESGDNLANGVYLYRVEVRSGGSSGRSDMGRLVMMR